MKEDLTASNTADHMDIDFHVADNANEVANPPASSEGDYDEEEEEEDEEEAEEEWSDAMAADPLE